MAKKNVGSNEILTEEYTVFRIIVDQSLTERDKGGGVLMALKRQMVAEAPSISVTELECLLTCFEQMHDVFGTNAIICDDINTFITL